MHLSSGLFFLILSSACPVLLADTGEPLGGEDVQEGGEVQADPGYYGYGDRGGGGGYRKKGGHYHKKTGSYGHHQKMCDILAAPMNSAMHCRLDVCVATCKEQHTFPSGDTSMTFHCVEGRWVGQGPVGEAIPECSPLCLPGCMNGGRCVSPNVCHCPGNYFGPYCQYERKPCYDFPPAPMNSHIVCAADTCTIACSGGHSFFDGSSVATVVCKEGEWRPARNDWNIIPDCLAVCSPPCQNGGVCYGENSCNCPQDFRGPQCQYSMDVCDGRHLAFNGNYNCSVVDQDTLSCRLNCPEGMRFNTQPAEHYVCRYATGLFEPSPVPTCVFQEGHEEEILTYIFSGRTSSPEISHEFIIHESNRTSKYKSKTYGGSNSKTAVLIRKPKKPTTGACISWKKDHVKTFDGRVISFKSDCVYNLLSNDDNSFHIHTPVVRDNTCNSLFEVCNYVTIFVNDKEYQLFVDGNGVPAIKSDLNVITIPSQVPGMKVDLGPKSIKATLQTSGVVLNWDLKDIVEVQVLESSWNKTTGLCGRIDGYEDNDLSTFHESIEEYVSEARVLKTGAICQEKVFNNPPCTDIALQQLAQEFCSNLLHNKKFKECHDVVPPQQYYDACLWDYCSCESTEHKNCGCESLAIYVGECKRHGIKVPSWRDDDLCSVKCSGGRRYTECGRDTPCGAAEREDVCEEGCFCPPGTYVFNDTCLTLDSCPCTLRGREFKPGAEVPKDCNTCICTNGTWSCTNAECGAQCEAVGDPHYKTFDKRTYDFMGRCSYYLLKMDNYSVEAENVPCDGAISEDLGFLAYALPGLPSCTKTVTVRLGDTDLKLKQGKEMTVNGEDVRLPVALPHAYVTQASSIFILVDLDDGVEIWWDGVSRVYINAPPSLKGKTKGLCGTFNGNQKDDFLTPEGDVEQDPVSFANKWKTKESCGSDAVEAKNPCDANVQNRAEAEKYCAHITSNLFLDCHFHVDPVSYYQNCLYDMCACARKKSECFCPIISAYAKECANQGIPIDWRSHVRECGLQCPRGQVYETCGKPCLRSCDDISRQHKCNAQLCSEGCNCPPGFTLDQRGACIPVSQCPCLLNSLQYPPGHAEIRPGSKSLQLCKCINALWECHEATVDELKKYPNNSLEDVTCSATKNQVYSHCEPAEPVTCQNMGLGTIQSSPSICYGGCVCKKGYVLDSISKECVKPEECPCHHGGKSYGDGAEIQENCNTCVCNMGRWTCTDHECPGVCTAWGDSHFKTFDDRLFDFQGTCDYILAKGSASIEDCFTITIEMASCSTSGVSCPKSIKVSAGSVDKKESVTFADHSSVQSNTTLQRIAVRDVGLFLFADIPDLGIVLQWDKGSRVSVRVDPKWKGKVKGLCGNYNGDTSDDFETPSGGSEVSSQIFGDSWKLHDYCPQTLERIVDTCAIRPHRKAWAIEKCSILKSDVFKHCHSEVPLDFYWDKCIFDSCACDEGGDCECLCTAVAAYAQECNAHGVHIRWRSQNFCPIQCDATCATYSPCISTCPPETCDNSLSHKALTQMCNQDICVEGCKLKPCPEGEIYKNSSFHECIPKALCKPLCKTINGKDYYEGDLIEGDDCHSCFCTRGDVSCTGRPCTTPLPTTLPTTVVPTTTEVPRGDKDVCVSGWTEWINTNPVDDHKLQQNDTEPLPTFKGFGVKGAHCDVSKMTAIRCRTVRSHIPSKETGQDVECSLERGMVCINGCSDFEIQVYCQCEPTTTRLTTTSSTTTPTTTEIHTTERKVTEPTVAVTHPVTTESVCKENEVWDECAIECDKLCLFYEYALYQSGTCMFGQKCSPGCRPIDQVPCGEGYRWRERGTCVKEEDCTCRSHTGEIVKPGKVVNETDCKFCQCLSNHYRCDESACFTSEPTTVEATTAPPPTETLITLSTVTPPAETCEENRFIPLLNDLPSTVFSSSSDNSNPNYSPQKAHINALGGSWIPGVIDENQYLQIDLGHVDVIYAIYLKGDIVDNFYVTRFYVLYSLDNIAYSYVTLDGNPQLFFGPSYHLEPRFQVFGSPFEARYVRVNPVAWVGTPAIKVELMGCGLATTLPPVRLVVSTTQEPTTLPSTLPPTSTSPPVCLDKMSNYMNDQQVKVSSTQREPFTAATISVYKDEGWLPLSTDPNHWVQFDFLGERTLTGIMTAGNGFKLNQKELMPSWVTKYYITYSHDEEEWNPILAHDGTRQIFVGNEDNTNIKTTMLRIPIRARYVRIIPTEWHNSIALRVQMLGCYEPYPILTTTTEIPTTKAECELCPGATLPGGECPCSSPLLWDGEQCTTRSQCPCFIGFIPYDVGTTFDNDKCEQCICALNGLPQCKKKECPPCEEGLRKEMTAGCACICRPCETGQRLCPTSNICINSTSWCDGVQDCSDDELDCPTSPPSTMSTTPPSTTTVEPTMPTKVTRKVCPPPPVCRPGTKLEKISEPEKKDPFWTPFGTKSKWSGYFKGNPRERQGYGARHKGARKSHKGGFGKKGGHKGGHKGGFGFGKTHHEKEVEEPVCDKYICSCEEKPECPPGTNLVIITATSEDECDQFSCPTPPDKYCFVNGRTFTTFDGVEYKYDICDHVIAQDRVNKEWQIREIKTCPFIGPCEKSLLIKYENHTIRLNTDQTIIFDGYAYTVPQMQKIGSQSEEFAIKQVNDKFIIFSSRLGFSLIWDSQANIKVVVPGTSSGEVEGLCGYMDDNPANDKRKPNGERANTSVEFGNSWGESIDCETKACPAHVQKEAFEMCKALRDDPIAECGKAISLDKLHSQCVEGICLCSESSNSTEPCRCDAILKAVTDCQAALPNLDLSSWRVQNDCPVECPEGLVFKECFKRTCEPCCAELLTPDACPETTECFPGCYCPDGYVRNYDQCVKPAECRDCICEGYGASRFVSFDKLDYSYNANCTHVLAQTLKTSPGPQFKILITNGLCEDNIGSTCLKKISIFYKEHTIQTSLQNRSVSVTIDGKNCAIPVEEKWVKVKEVFGRGIVIHLPKIQIDLEVSNDMRNYKLKMPSHLYSGRTEGLCGSCNLNITDDLKKSDNSITDNINDFGQSWRVTDLPSILDKEDSCASQNITEECLPPPPENDKCLMLMDEKLFGQCHAVIDPSIFIANCHDALCHGITNVCREFEEYARECQAEGICLKWRSPELCPYTCPLGLQYEPCGLGCTETCDNFEVYRKSPEKCQTPRGDTCVCPQGKVLKNGTCVEESRCSPCDTEGHYPGDEWKPDSCTVCKCNARSVECQRIHCPPKQHCDSGSKSLVVPGTEADCCPQYICTPTESCPPAQKLKCGTDQILKVEINKNGCEEYTCVCKPKDECPDISKDIDKAKLEPGFVAEVDESGCCPLVVKTCWPGNCPKKECPEFQIPVKKGEGLCCPVYDCDLPPNQCLYEFVNEQKGLKTLKTIGDIWKDGPCRTCECRPGGSSASCTEQFCQTPPESDNYVYEATVVNNKCCPIYKRKGCKFGDKVYQVGETWPSPNDPCKNCSCVIGSNGEILKEDSVQSCTSQCKKGYEYVEPPVGSGLCCGECKPIGCVVNGTLHPKDSSWSSPDNCTIYTCSIEDGEVHIASSEETCPSLDSCPEENIYVDGCCKKCNETRIVEHSACTAELVPLNTTVRLVQVFDEERGPCANIEPISGFKECKGICDSYTEFDWRTGLHESNCLCCQGANYETLTVILACADGSILEREVPVPSSCKCLICAGSHDTKPQKLVSGTSVKGKKSVKTKKI